MTRLHVATLATALAIVTTLAGGLGAQQGKADVDLRAAIELETVRGDLKGAIEAYKKVADEHRGNRAVAAQALLKLAEAYQKQGSAEARGVLERIVRDYPDQATVVSTARQGLEALNGGAATAAASLASMICSDCIGRFNGLSIGPDGRSLFYTAGNNDIAVRNLATGAVTMLNANQPGPGGPFRARFPVPSPDGKQLVFTLGDTVRGDAPGQLRIMANVPNARSSVLVDNPEFRTIAPLAWSPDGNRVLVEIMRPDETWQIAWVSTNTGDVTVLTSRGWSNEYYHGNRAALSPDGRFIAYTARVNNPSGPGAPRDAAGKRLYVLRSDGQGQETALVESANFHGFPVWTRDGSRILFLSDSGSGDDNHLGLWAIGVRDGKSVGTPALLKLDVGNRDTAVAGVTASGSLYYRVVPGGVGQVTVHALTRGSGATSTAGATFVGSGATWSPNGKLLAFRRNQSRDLIVRSMDTGEERLLFASPSRAVSPIRTLTWLEDGSGLLIIHAAPERSIARVDLRTGEYRHIASVSEGQLGVSNYHVVSPDGLTAYFAPGSGGPRSPAAVVAVDLGTGRVRAVATLPSSGAHIRRVAVSPDSQTLALRIESQRPGKAELRIAVVRVDGTGYREIFGPVPSVVQVDGLDWTADGHIAFDVISASGRLRAMRISPEGTEPVFTGLELERPFLFSRLRDGSIFVARPADGRQRVVRMGAAGGAAIDTGVELAQGQWFTVSPDGSRIAAQQVLQPAADELWSFDLSPLINRR